MGELTSLPRPRGWISGALLLREKRGGEKRRKEEKGGKEGTKGGKGGK